MRINRETMSKRIYHIVDVVGEVAKRPVFIIKTHKISVKQSPPNCGRENEGLGTRRALFQPMAHFHICEEACIIEFDMIPNNTREFTVTDTMKERAEGAIFLLLSNKRVGTEFWQANQKRNLCFFRDFNFQIQDKGRN